MPRWQGLLKSEPGRGQPRLVCPSPPSQAIVQLPLTSPPPLATLDPVPLHSLTMRQAPLPFPLGGVGPFQQLRHRGGGRGPTFGAKVMRANGHGFVLPS